MNSRQSPDQAHVVGRPQGASAAALDESGGRNPEAALRALAAAEHDRWDEFAVSSGCGTIFHTTWWHRAWGMEPVVLAMSDSQGRIEAGICYSIGRRFGTQAIRRPPLTPRNGPLFVPGEDSVRHRQNTHRKQMLLKVIQSLPRLGVYDFQLRAGDTDTMPFLWNGFDATVEYTYVIPCADGDGWTRHASKTQQRRLRTAAKEVEQNGFVLEMESPFEDVWRLFDETAEIKRYAKTRDSRAAVAWWNAVQRQKAGRTYLLRDGEGRPASATIMVHDQRTAYYLGGGIRRDLRQGSMFNVFLFHRMIADAHGMGLDFDFEGSILPGVERFFRSLGGQLQPLYRVVKLPSPMAYTIWHAHRYWTKHRRRQWTWYD